MIKANNLKTLFDTEDLYNSNPEDKILGIQTFMNNSGSNEV